MGTKLRTFALACAAVFFSFTATAESFTSPNSRVSLLELYTSEGCSSCPPADEWVSELKTDPRLWRELVPVAFHVDYWDYIGWPDRFATADFGDRQRRYAASGTVKSVYTPGLVVNGGEWRAWFRNPKLKLEHAENVGPLQLEVNDTGVSARFEPAQSTAGALELHVAVLGFDMSSQVQSGENSGRRLNHDFVVLGHQVQDLQQIGREYFVNTTLPQIRHDAARKAVAAWVSEAGQPHPLQAVGGWLKGG